ncbi:MAG: hypothetical protein NVSMB31_17040 [Vulcanimicrobiaceae bacterium]
MKKLLLASALALSTAFATTASAQANSLWTFNVPVDVTNLTKGGYSANALGVFVECTVHPANNPALEVGSGYKKHVSVPASGVLTVHVEANPNGHYTGYYNETYSCVAAVGPIDKDWMDATTGGPATGTFKILPATLPINTQPIILKLHTSAKPKHTPTP